MSTRARVRARLRRNRAIGVTVSLLVGLGVVAGTIGSASADPSAGDWLKLRNCESGGDYSIDTGNGYYGAYQFDLGTWRSVGGSGVPSDASPATQDALAYKLWQERGWSPWTCARIVGLPAGGSGGPAIVVKAVHRTVPPAGHFDRVAISPSRTTLRIYGWALDPASSSASSAVQIMVNGHRYTVTAQSQRPDVDRVMKVSGRHGFSLAVAVNPGSSNQICATALGKSGVNASLGCRTVRVERLPMASLDSIKVNHGKAVMSGWADDPNASGRTAAVEIYVNGVEHRTAASWHRPDVNARLHIAGPHGFRAALPLHRGTNEVCTYAVGIDGSKQSLGCRSVFLSPPIGSLDPVKVHSGTGSITGWAYEPSSSGTSLNVVVYVNGIGRSVPTSVVRPDVNRINKISGSHGFRLNAALRPGNNQVCATAVGVTAGNRSLGCVTVRG